MFLQDSDSADSDGAPGGDDTILAADGGRLLVPGRGGEGAGPAGGSEWLIVTSTPYTATPTTPGPAPARAVRRPSLAEQRSEQKQCSNKLYVYICVAVSPVPFARNANASVATSYSWIQRCVIIYGRRVSNDTVAVHQRAKCLHCKSLTVCLVAGSQQSSTRSRTRRSAGAGRRRWSGRRAPPCPGARARSPGT